MCARVWNETVDGVMAQFTHKLAFVRFYTNTMSKSEDRY